MQNFRGAFFWTFALVGGYFVWRNRFAIQRQLESMGIKTPLLKGGLGEEAQSAASKIGGKFEHGVDIAERKVGNY